MSISLRFKLPAFLLASLCCSTEVCLSDVEDDPTGTPEREEVEYKFAFALPSGFSIRPILDAVSQEMSAQENSTSYQLPKFVDAKYTFDGSFSPFVFKDIYFDTKGLDILKSRSSYRLRYRWSKLAHYSRHLLFPQVKPFYPTRCEIQFKKDYSTLAEENKVKVFESRFEFRNESEPFIIEQDAPNAPWPEKEYINYSIHGKFRDYAILPYFLMREKLQSKAPISPVVTVETVRYRTHLNISRNPWAWGPNQNQAFIVTFDVSSWTYADGSKNTQDILEIEIEVDRNIMTMAKVVAGINAETYLSQLAKSNSNYAANLLAEDQKLISMRLKELINSNGLIQPLPTDYKYSRIMKKKG